MRKGKEKEGKSENGQVLIFITFDSQAIFFVRSNAIQQKKKRSVISLASMYRPFIFSFGVAIAAAAVILLLKVSLCVCSRARTFAFTIVMNIPNGNNPVFEVII